MKKIFFTSLILILLTGCGTYNSNDILKKISNNINDCDSYYLEGKMEIINNEDTYSYDVNVSYKEEDFYKVDLINTSNNHEQIILRNDDGVYVVTPNLNKSFKFQSDWPYNNSQVYLLNSIISDINNDPEYTNETTDDGYILTSSVNYPNNASLVKQIVYIDKKLNITKVEIVDTDNNVQIKMEFSNIEIDHDFDDDYFDLSNIISIDKNTTDNSNSITNDNTTNNTTNNSNNTTNNNTNEKEDNTNQENNNDITDSNTNTESGTTNSTKSTATIDDIIYPMYLPTNTYLTDQKTINTDDGQRLILTFDGDSSFILIEETSVNSSDDLIMPVNGNIDFVADVIAVVGESSISWTSGGIDYYMVSDDLQVNELLKVARSISALPVSK